MPQVQVITKYRKYVNAVQCQRGTDVTPAKQHSRCILGGHSRIAAWPIWFDAVLCCFVGRTLYLPGPQVVQIAIISNAADCRLARKAWHVRVRPALAENRIDFSVLRDLTDQDLKDLGIVLGDRRKMLRVIGELDAASL